MSDGVTTGNGAAYRVLARKYRPALLRRSHRSAADGPHPDQRLRDRANCPGLDADGRARRRQDDDGARILARALDYETDTIHHRPTIHMEGPGVHCQAIMEGRHVDVVEMDAASHTGIDDVREIIAQVALPPGFGAL